MSALELCVPVGQLGEVQDFTECSVALAHVLSLIDEAVATHGAPGGLSNLVAAEAAAGRFLVMHRETLTLAIGGGGSKH